MSWISLERKARNAMAAGIGRLFPVQKVSPESLRAEWAQGRIKNVLLLRPHQGMGDLLMATPMFRAIKAVYPATRLGLLVTSYNARAVADNPDLDKVWVWNKSRGYRPAYLMSFLRMLRAERYDLAVVVSSHTPSFTSFLLARLTGAKRVVAFQTQSFYGGANWSRWMAHTELPNSPADAPEWATFMDLVRPMGVEGPYEPQFHISTEDQRWAMARWETFSFPSNRPVVGMYLGGNPARPNRLWLPEYWAELARQLAPHASVLPVAPPEGILSGSQVPEPGVYERFSAHLGRRLPAFRELEFSKMTALLKYLNLFICPDGGVMHFAVAGHVPTLALCFETDHQRWVPPVPWAFALRPADQKPASLLPDDVFRAVRGRLSLTLGVAR